MENKVKCTTIERWEKIGFLDGLNDVQKHNVSEGMDHMANLLINEQLQAKPQENETLLFPIVRRIIQPIERELDIETIKDCILQIGERAISEIPDLIKKFQKLNMENLNIDVEAEAVAQFCKSFELNLNK
jgi:hypothetical protein